MDVMWFEVGEKTVDVLGGRDSVKSRYESFKWIDLTKTHGVQLGFFDSHTIKEIVQEFKIPKVLALALDDTLPPWTFYGIDGSYKNGRARTVFASDGVIVTPLYSEFWPNSQ